MRKKSGLTIVEQAIVLIPEFEKVVRKLKQQVTLRGQSKSTLQNYIRRIALFVVHFGKLPEQIDPEEINEYLVALARGPKSPSRSSFKHMVYGLRYYYRLLGMNKNAIALPSLRKDTKLPVILNYSELKELFAVPILLKQRVVLTLIYSAGLRGQEVINLKISDIDFERMTIHIRQSKYKKDRVVPLAHSMAVGLKKYLKAENPHIWLFNGKEKPHIDTLLKQKEPKETNQERFKRLTGVDPCQCPVCKKGTMIAVRELPRIRSPTWHALIPHLVPTF